MARIPGSTSQAPKLHIKKLLDYNLEKLSAVYQAALNSTDDEGHRKALEASQKAWLEFFAADGVVAGWNAKGGSSAYPAQVEQRIYQVRSRIYQLSTPFSQGWQAIPRVRNPRAGQGAAGQSARVTKNSQSKPAIPKIQQTKLSARYIGKTKQELEATFGAKVAHQMSKDTWDIWDNLGPGAHSFVMVTQIKFTDDVAVDIKRYRKGIDCRIVPRRPRTSR